MDGDKAHLLCLESAWVAVVVPPISGRTGIMVVSTS